MANPSFFSFSTPPLCIGLFLCGLSKSIIFHLEWDSVLSPSTSCPTDVFTHKLDSSPIIPSALFPDPENCVHSSDYRDQKPHGSEDGKRPVGIQMSAQLLWFWGIPLPTGLTVHRM